MALALPEGPIEVAFVGNAPTVRDISAKVDGADWVVRFNKARGFDGAAGSRLDDLFVINSGGQMREWLDGDAFWTSAPVARAGCITLPVPVPAPPAGSEATSRDGANYARAAKARLRGLDRPVRILNAGVQRAALKALRAGFWPSTGFLALTWYDAALPPGACITLHGFTFTGWDGHDWEGERAWIDARAHAGRIRLADGR